MQHARFPIDEASGRMHRHPFYARTLAALGAEVGFRQGGVIEVTRRVGPLRLAWWPDPPVLPDLQQLRLPTLINAPDAAMDAALSGSGAIRVWTPATRAVMDLSGEPCDLRAAMQARWRNRLLRAEGAGLRLTHAPLPDDPGHWLLQAEIAQQRARRYRALPPAFALAWPETRLFTLSRKRGAPLAAMLFLLHAPGATYHIGWSGPEGRALNAHNLLLWQAMVWLQARGITRLELGPLDTTRARGLARFKLGSGARPETSGHCWLYSRRLAPMGRLLG